MNISHVVGAQRGVYDGEVTESLAESDTTELEPSVPVIVDKGLNETPSRSLHLSNRERLLLRKQALKMKKRPVLAVGNCSWFSVNTRLFCSSFQFLFSCILPAKICILFSPKNLFGIFFTCRLLNLPSLNALDAFPKN